MSAIDLFCGAGGLSLGLRQAGISVVAGIDTDPRCKYPFETNIAAGFLQQDVRTVTGEQLERLWGPGRVRLLAGCPPCQPFSAHRRGADTSKDSDWPLLDEFARLVCDTTPEVVTMENVPRITNTNVFDRFTKELDRVGYYIDFKTCRGPRYGLPQQRRRLVLVASRYGPLQVPPGSDEALPTATVRKAIESLQGLNNGGVDSLDPLHACRTLTETNMLRIIASRPGGTWRDWPEELRAPCHRSATGASFQSVYARMEWDQPSPTITTQFFNFGTGRFGHPEQNRGLSIREGAILQGFPPTYKFVKPGSKIEFAPLGKLIGNAVPPPMAKAIGDAIATHIRNYTRYHFNND